MTAPAAKTQQSGIPGYPGPYGAGRYALGLREQLRGFADVSLIGEVTGCNHRKNQVFFELRDADGAIPCAMWRTDFERTGMRQEELCDGVEVVVAGGCDFYPGSATASPRFQFRVETMRPAGEGDLFAQLERLRRQLAGEGLFERQKALRVAPLPRTIGVVTGEGSAACRDFLAALARRGWQGTIVWGYAPVQDRRAAPAIAKAIRDLALLEEVETIVVTRGGGSIADLWAFCDESLCRTVALLAKPVISAVGHEVDRTLIDDVAAASCSTPTHAAEVAVRVDCADARRRLLQAAARLADSHRGRDDHLARLERAATRLHVGTRAGLAQRGRDLAALSRAPREHVARHRRDLWQNAKELRAASSRGLAARAERQSRIASLVLPRKIEAASALVARALAALRRDGAGLDRAAADAAERRRQTLARLTAALDARDPQRTLERGYAVALGPDGEPLATAEAVRAAGDFDLRMSDGTVPARLRKEQ